VKKKLFTESKRLAIGLPLAVAVCIFIGCASTGGGNNKPPGTLTITGFPAEYEGKFVSAGMQSIPDYDAKIPSSKAIARGEHTAITNGEVKLPVYIEKMFGKGGAYTDSDTIDVMLEISDGIELSHDGRESSRGRNLSFLKLSIAAFSSVTFEDGVAEVQWDNAAKAGYISVTNIPAEYSNYAQITVGKLGPQVFGQFMWEPGTVASGSSGIPGVEVVDGKVTIPVLPSRDESGYISFTETSTKDIVLALTPLLSDSAVTKSHQFLFKDVEITDGKALIDFRRGVKQ
jgi:hypothetical protein